MDEGGFIIDLKSDEEETYTDTEESDAEETTRVSTSLTGSSVLSKTFYEPLNLVWAKLPSFPWSPGIILSPSTIKSDLQILKLNNVSLPSNELLKSKEFSKNDYLIYFFELKNPWYWIANTKLKQFGGVDDKKFLSLKKSSKYKSKVQSAYKKALEIYNLLKPSEKIEIKMETSNNNRNIFRKKQNFTNRTEFDC
jgi:hypothetical protein